MLTRSPRTILAISAALALTASALGSGAVLAKGPNGNGACSGDCTADQQGVQRQARAGVGPDSSQAIGRWAGQDENGRGRYANGRGQDDCGGGAVTDGWGRNAGKRAGRGPNEDGQRGPGSCEDCAAAMGVLTDDQAAPMGVLTDDQAAPMGVLTDDQAAGLAFMGNEEKLAHDVYTVFAEQYGVPIFSNIAESEAMHQQAVSVTLDRYGLEDTAIDLPAGEFSDPLIASLYDTLIEQGSASLEEAIAVGVLIEETDIADLESRLEGLEQSAPDVHEMYSLLLAASKNHLAAFESWR